jgi:uncharacterized protein Yka (UPF0111/DUF47 family)
LSPDRRCVAFDSFWLTLPTFETTMVSLERLLGRQEKFLELFEASAEQAHQSAAALARFIQKSPEQRSLNDFVGSRRQDKEITARISEELCAGSITSLDRDDIESLSNSLYKIPKTIEKIAERILLAPHYLHGVDIVRQITMLENAAAALLAMIKDLRKGMDARRVRDHNSKLQNIEGDADKAVLEMLRQLYNGKQDPIQAMFLKDLFELIEKVTDRCRDAGNTITAMVLKNS